MYLLLFGWKPGQNAYLSVPEVSPWGWEAHPFTITTIDSLFTTKDTRSGEGKSHQENERELEIKFLIRVRRGFTRRLFDHATQQGGSCNVSAYVDGPYGDPPKAYAYPNVILIAGISLFRLIKGGVEYSFLSPGGSGVSFTMPLLLDLVR